MSRVISEVGADRKRNWTGIGLTLAGIVVILAIPIAAITVTVWAATESSQDQTYRDYARLAARDELLRRHWKALETQKDFHPVIDAMFQDTLPVHAEHKCQVKVVDLAASDSAEVSSFERGAFQQLKTGTGEVWSSSKGETVRFVSAVRLKESCMACHPVVRGQPDKRLNVGDVCAFVSVQRNPPQNEK